MFGEREGGKETTPGRGEEKQCLPRLIRDQFDFLYGKAVCGEIVSLSL